LQGILSEAVEKKKLDFLLVHFTLLLKVAMKAFDLLSPLDADEGSQLNAEDQAAFTKIGLELPARLQPLVVQMRMEAFMVAFENTAHLEPSATYKILFFPLAVSLSLHLSRT
jgi:hypothetical protein